MRRVLKWVGLSLGALVALVAGLALLLFAKFADGPPEMGTGRRDVELVRTSTTMVVTANPHATAAGVEILKAGGSAIDAAVAIQAVLTLVEPQSSGIGGGAFLLHYDGHALEAIDGREQAPEAVTPALFLHEDRTPYNFVEAVVGGRSVGVPGALAALALAHEKHGKLPWKQLFTPAIELCREGFEVSPRLHALLDMDPLLRTMPAARAYLYEGGRPKPAGAILKNPELAEVLTEIAERGPDAFYRGPIATDIAAAVKRASRPSLFVAGLNFALVMGAGAPFGSGMLADEANPGYLTEADLARYEAKVRPPICRPYRRWRVCGFPPPTSGGISVLQILGLLERFDLAKLDPNSAEAAHLIAEAERLAYADRDYFIGDDDFVDVPVAGLIDTAYLTERSKLIDPGKAAAKGKHGNPPGWITARAEDASWELPSTSHFVIADRFGNVISMTTSIENVFGSRVFVRGFLLNNQLTDFSFVPVRGHRPVANAVEAGKRPRSSMSPMIVFDAETNRPVLAVGSPGGANIIGYVARALLGALDWGLDPRAAASLPHVLNRNAATELENAGWPDGRLEEVRNQLESMGHTVKVREQNSGLSIIALTKDGLLGGADPRREGVAAGF